MKGAVLIVAGLALTVLAACQNEAGKQVKRHYPDEHSQAFAVYASHCSECHAPPLPRVHKASEWPAVVERMKLHMVELRIAPMSADDEITLRNYLVSHAPGG